MDHAAAGRIGIFESAYFFAFLLTPPLLLIAAWAAASRAMGRGRGCNSRIEPDLVAEVDALGVAAVLAANAALKADCGRRGPSSRPSTSCPTPSTSSVWNGSRSQDFLLQIVGQEPVDVVAAVAEGHLRQVVGAEAEEIGGLGQFVGRHRGARHFDHRAQRYSTFTPCSFITASAVRSVNFLRYPIRPSCRPAES